MAVWLALSVVVLAVAGLGMRHALAASARCWALSLNVLAALLISPISWSHHWVWCVPAVLTLAALSRRYLARLPLGLGVCGLLVFGAAPQWWFPASAGRELRWVPWEQVVGSSYVLFAALVLLLSASAILTRREHGGPRRPARAWPRRVRWRVMPGSRRGSAAPRGPGGCRCRRGAQWVSAALGAVI